jgi:hypothetical protein
MLSTSTNSATTTRIRSSAATTSPSRSRFLLRTDEPEIPEPKMIRSCPQSRAKSVTKRNMPRPARRIAH